MTTFAPNARNIKALEVLMAGGYFRHALESNFRGHEKFVTRLYTSTGSVVPGVGYATRKELAPVLQSQSFRSSVWPTECRLRTA